MEEFFGVRVRTWLPLVVVGTLASVTVLPYYSTLTGRALPLTPVLVLLGLIQYAIIFGIVILLGLRLSEKVGLRAAPVIEGRTKLSSVYRQAIVLGLLAGGIVFLLAILLPLGGFLGGQSVPPAWQGFLASFYGGICEEILLRLFLVPLIAFFAIGAAKLFGRERDWTAGSEVMWFSIFAAAFLFGMGHLPATAAITSITLYVVLRAVLLNGVAGVIFGWLFCRRGIESAMISHFSADVFLHAILPLFFL